jgi:molybdate transport system substrate-binding protein
MLQRPHLIVALLATLVSMLSGSSAALAVDIACPQAPPATPVTTPAAITAQDAQFPEGDVEITVFAAASLTDAFAEIETAVEEAYPSVSITVETAGSQTLVTQLREGAEADVLATADPVSMRDAQEAGLIDGEPATFTANRLVIVTPPDNPAGIEGVDDLAGDDVRLVIAGEDVPAGRYAREALCAWAGGNADTLAAIGDNVVSEEIDVRSTLAKVQLGEADAGIVYASDAAASERAGMPLNVIEFPDDVPTAATYPIASVSGGDTEAARAFIAFVLSDEGQQILEEYGFTPVP